MLPSNIKYIQTLENAKAGIKSILLSNDYYWGTDTETTGLDPHENTVRLIQLATDDVCYIFDVFNIGKNNIKLLFNYLLDKVKGKRCFILHNFKFDVKMFWSLGIDFTGQIVYDTMIASTVINCGLSIPNGLLFVADRFLGIELDKTEQKDGWDAPVLPEAKIIYAANDVLPLKKLVPILDRELANEGLEDTFKLEMRAVYGFAEMEYFGIKLDTERLALLKPIYEERLKKAHTDFLPFVPNRYERKNLFGEVVDYGIELTSSAQVLKVLRNLNVPNPLYNPESRDIKDHDPLIPSTGADIVKLLDVVDYPVVEALLEYRKVSKLLTSYIYNLPDMVNPVTGRVHAHFNQIVSTGRSAANSPNVNNIPRPDGSDLNIRSCFIADKGFKFSLADMCLVKGTLVATTNGLKPIEEITTDDYVYQDNQDTPKVNHVIKQGKLPVFKLTTTLGYSLTGSGQHRIRVLENNEYIWKHIKDIKEKDQVAICADRGFNSVEEYVKLPELKYVHHSNKQINVPEYADERFSEFLGYLTGDGSYSKYSIFWVACDKDRDVFDVICDSAINMFGYIGKETQYRGVYESCFHSTVLTRWLSDLNSNKKQVPTFLYNSPKSVIAAYIRGLFEADGSVTDRITLTTVSPILMREVHLFLLSLGIVSVFTEKPISRMSIQQPYMINIPAAFSSKFQEVIGFIGKRKKDKLAALVEKSNYSGTYGSIPLTGEFIKSHNLKGDIYGLLRNSIVLGRPTSLNVAKKINTLDPQLSCKLGFNRTVEDSVYYDKIKTIEYIGEEDCFDLSINHRQTYISNGFVSHNSQIELRVIASVSKDENMLNEFKEGKDPYASTAALLNNLKYENIVKINPEGEDKIKPEHKKARQQAKAVRLGMNYGMGFVKFRNYAKQQYGVTFTLGESKKVREKYFESYPGLQQYHNLFIDKNMKETITLPPFNRKRKWDFYPGVPGLSNLKIQGSSGDIQKLAIARIYEELHKDGYSPTQSHDCRLVLTVHDELEIEVKEEIAEYARELLERNMVEAGEFVIKDCPIKAEADIVDNLAQKS